MSSFIWDSNVISFHRHIFTSSKKKKIYILVLKGQDRLTMIQVYLSKDDHVLSAKSWP